MSQVKFFLVEKGEQGFVLTPETTKVPEAGGWFSLTENGEQRGFAFDLDDFLLDDAQRLVAVCTDDSDYMQRVEGDADHVWTLTALRAETTPKAMAAKRQFPWWRVNGTRQSRWGASSPIENEVVELPVPLPETAPTNEAPLDAGGGVTVTELIEPVFGVTISGYAYDSDAETTT